MNKRLAEHIGSILVVALIFGIGGVIHRESEARHRETRVAPVAPYLAIPDLDFGNPLHRALFQETLKIFRPDSLSANTALVRAIDAYREAEFTDPLLKTGAAERGISLSALSRLAPMYTSFVIVYIVALLLTLYGAQSLGVYRFISLKQGRESLVALALSHVRDRDAWRLMPVRSLLKAILLLVGAIVKGILLLGLFAPAYVVGYAFKSELESGGVLFMIFLGVVSNGLLIMYANRFFTLLVSESRKGYVETALAKGLSREWGWNIPGGIRFASLMRLRKSFSPHVLQHVYMNARYQYLPALKEQASFLITGLIIAEMALNIQGHLGYELMQRILDRQYDVVLLIAFGIYLLIKVTDILVDGQTLRESRRYENLE